HSLEGYERIPRPDHAKTLSRVTSLAGVLQLQGKCNEAETMDRCALEGCEKVLGPDHANTLASANSLARVLRVRGKSNEWRPGSWCV
ncbi:hypothetical protein C7212DRAFT_176537, partial [Tuber magnatum]